MPDRSQQTEKATPRHLDKARKEGRFASARDFVAGVQFLIFVSIVAAWSAHMMSSLREITAVSLRWAFRAGLTPQGIISLAAWLLGKVILGIAILGATMMGATIVATMAVTRFGLSLKPLAPDITRLNPLSRLRQLPKQNLPALLQAVLILPACGYGGIL